ncbi:hypothetical protein PybrP1_002975 [[Pythium] brassicae (nom. inval.)]|nr:hypothetical protein PybrP1_002975 [[Pythium] brassicae (nom. inval.)]
MARGRAKTNTGRGMQRRQYKRDVPTNHFQLAVAQHFKQHGMKETLMRFFGDVGGDKLETKRKSIHLWAKRHGILEAATSAAPEKRRQRPQGTARTLPVDAERELMRWIDGYHAHSAPISATMLKHRALALANELDILPDEFAASWLWRKEFLTRNGLSFRAPDSCAAQKQFAAELRKRMDELKVGVVINADQTPIFFEHLPRTTLAAHGVNMVWVRTSGKDKERFTCVLLGDLLGHKYALFLVFKTPTSARSEKATENTQLRHGFGSQLWLQVKKHEEENSAVIYSNKGCDSDRQTSCTRYLASMTELLGGSSCARPVESMSPAGYQAPGKRSATRRSGADIIPVNLQERYNELADVSARVEVSGSEICEVDGELDVVDSILCK